MKIEKSVQIYNRKARFEFEILEELEAGMVLTGTEIKSLRSSKASIAEAFCQVIEGELYIINMMIDEYKLGTFYNHRTRRERKLLVHRKELTKLERKLKDAGNTIVPLKLYINDKGKAKVLIALARGKKLYDKRESIKEREEKRSLGSILKKS